MYSHNKQLVINFDMRVVKVLLVVAALAGGTTAVLAAVDDDWGTSDLLAGGIVVPYDGFLMLGSDAANGERDVTFELWDHETSTNSSNLIWSETQTVEFFNGRFSVGLGTGTQTSVKTIDQAILDGEQLYLAVQVKDNGGAWVDLAGRQEIEAVPYSAWSANAADFTVQGLLDAKGDVDVAGSVDVAGELNTEGKVGINTGGVYNLWVQGSDTAITSGDARNLALLGMSESHTQRPDELYINYGNEYSNGVTVDSNLHVDGNLTGDISNNFTLSTEYTASVSANAGNSTLRHDSSFVNMTPVASSICTITYYFTGVATNGQNDKVLNYCRIRSDTSNWRLRASLERKHVNQAGNTACYARCVSW